MFMHPMQGNKSFLKKNLEAVKEISEENIVIAGDFNAVPDPKLDKSKPIEGNKLPKSTIKALAQVNIGHMETQILQTKKIYLLF